MNVDPSMNVVVFEVFRNGKSEPLTEQGVTQAPDCIKSTWLKLQQKHNLRPNDIRKIYSEWCPSPEDMQFLSETFPDKLEVSFSFDRPSDGDWEKAFAEVKQTILKSLEEKETQQRSPMLLPILRNMDTFSQAIVHREIIPELGVFLATVGPTPRGTIGIDYLMTEKVKAANGNVSDLWGEAYSNLTLGLQVNSAAADSESYIMMNRQGSMAASALALPDFVNRAAEWVGSQRFIIAIPNPETLLLCDAQSRTAHDIQKSTLQSDYVGSVNLTPCVLLCDHGRLSLQAKRVNP